jgi:hypothetical protein
VTDTQFAALMPKWKKSSRSADNGCCVEVAEQPGYVAVRDSKNPDGATLQFPSAAWSHFLDGIKAGQFDLPSSAA